MSISEGQLSEILRHNRQMEVISRDILDLLKQMDKKQSAYMSAKLQLIMNTALEKEIGDPLRERELAITLEALEELDK